MVLNFESVYSAHEMLAILISDETLILGISDYEIDQ